MSYTPSLSTGIDKTTIDSHFGGDYLKFYSRFLNDLKPGSNRQAMVLCPFHEDRTPSLSINLENGQFHCFGCETEGDIFTFYAKIHNLNIQTDFPKILAGISQDFNIHNGNGKQTVKPTVTARYDYQDECRKLSYQIERLEPKSFRIRRPDGKDGWIYNKSDVRIIPYRLPSILSARDFKDTILICEGEKDADNLEKHGFIATCNPFGAGKWPEDFGQYFQDKLVVILPDNDEPGRSHAKQVNRNLQEYAWEIKYLELPNLPDKGDASDFLSTFNDKTDAANRLVELINEAPLFPKEAPVASKDSQSPFREMDRGFHFRSASDLCSAPSIADWLVKNYLDAGSFSMIFGESGTMKTFVSLDMGLSIAMGCDWQGHETRKSGPVFYIAGEGFAGINRRIKAWSIHREKDLLDIPFFVSDRAAQFLDDPIQVLLAVDDLRSANGEDPILIIIDTLSRNFGSGDENSTKDMARFVSVMDEEIRCRYHCAVMIIHHSGLTIKERSRGSSALRAALDFEYRLSQNADGSRVFTCTKAKDFEEPPTLCFKPKIITIDGWNDPDDGEVMTSLVMVRTDGSTQDEKLLSGPRKIALDALSAFDSDNVHIDQWREAAFKAGISTSENYEAKKKAFQRAMNELKELKLITSKGDFWSVGR